MHLFIHLLSLDDNDIHMMVVHLGRTTLLAEAVKDMILSGILQVMDTRLRVMMQMVQSLLLISTKEEGRVLHLIPIGRVEVDL